MSDISTKFLRRKILRQWQWILLASLSTLFSVSASATSKMGPPIYQVRIACTVTEAAATTSTITARRLCDEARTVVQELADGDIDPNVAKLPGWDTFADPNKQELLEKCHKQGTGGVGSCNEANYDLLYRGQQIPTIEIQPGAAKEADPESLTVLVKADSSETRDSTVAVKAEVIEPAFGSLPSQNIKIPTVHLSAARIAGSLHAELKLALAHYFLPETLNHIMGGVAARNRH